MLRGVGDWRPGPIDPVGCHAGVQHAVVSTGNRVRLIEHAHDAEPGKRYGDGVCWACPKLSKVRGWRVLGVVRAVVRIGIPAGPVISHQRVAPGRCTKGCGDSLVHTSQFFAWSTCDCQGNTEHTKDTLCYVRRWGAWVVDIEAPALGELRKQAGVTGPVVEDVVGEVGGPYEFARHVATKRRSPGMAGIWLDWQ